MAYRLVFIELEGELLNLCVCLHPIVLALRELISKPLLMVSVNLHPRVLFPC